MKKLLLILLCLPMIGFGQVIIPDANFKAYLVGNSAINTNGDTEIQVSEAAAFNGSIICNNMFISDLTGIEYFTALTYLECVYNPLTALDVSNNTALTGLDCSKNQLTTLDVSGATSLSELFCYDNQLTTLDVSNNTVLFFLNCLSNQLTTLDVSNNTALFYLMCQVNQLTSLDVRNGYNTNILDSMFSCSSNPNLTCINVDDAAWSNTNWTIANVNPYPPPFIPGLDQHHYFSTNCPPSAIQEYSTNKKLLRTIDVLGRETKNSPLFYIYDDGTVEKKIVIE